MNTESAWYMRGICIKFTAITVFVPVPQKFELPVSESIQVIQKGVIINSTYPSSVHHFVVNSCTK